MQGGVTRGVDRQALASAADFQGAISGLRRRSRPDHRRDGFFICDRHLPGRRAGGPAKSKEDSGSERATGVATKDHRDGRRWMSFVIRCSRLFHSRGFSVSWLDKSIWTKTHKFMSSPYEM